MQYKVNTAIRVRYLAVEYEEGLTDLVLTATSPSGVDQSPITMTEIGDGLYEALFTPDSVGWWSVRVTCVSTPVNVYGLTYYVGTTDNPYPAQQDELNNKIGEVQASPTNYTLLARLKDIWDKLNDLFTNGNGKVKLWDGTNQAGIDSENHIYVSGKAATGSTPTGNPVSVSGVDNSGYKRHLKTDSEGKLQVVQSRISGYLNQQVRFQDSHSAVNTNEWQEVLQYVIPSGYDLSIEEFDGFSQTAGESIRAIAKTTGGTFVGTTNTFTDGDAIIAPQFGNGINIYVTSAIGSLDDVITITYTNQVGTTGRTATVTLTKNSLIGTRKEVTLQTGDYGVIDITNVTHSQTNQTGNFDIEIFSGVYYLLMTSSNTQYSISYDQLISEEETVTLQYLAATKTTYIRRINLNATLTPR